MNSAIKRVNIAIVLCMVFAVRGSLFSDSAQIGIVYSVSPAKGEVVVSLSRDVNTVQMGSRMYLKLGERAVIMKAVFPMQTVVKCSLEKKYRSDIRSIHKGMPVYKYYAGVEGDDSASVRRYRSGDTKTVGDMELVYIQGGSIMMGSPYGEGESDENPHHKVTVDSFWIGKYEVTQEQYKSIMGDNPSYFSRNPKRPVEMVSWENAIEFCEKFSKKYNVAARLPYEAEWETAAGDGTVNRYYWGNHVDGDYCWYSDNSGYVTHPVGEKKPTKLGIYDIIGNVVEWCMDNYSEDYYKTSPERNPRGPKTGSRKVHRGGSVFDSGNDLRIAARENNLRGWFGSHQRCGFRIVISQDGSDTSR